MGNGGSAVVTARRPHESRWSARKADAVVRLLARESLEDLSREVRAEATGFGPSAMSLSPVALKGRRASTWRRRIAA